MASEVVFRHLSAEQMAAFITALRWALGSLMELCGRPGRPRVRDVPVRRERERCSTFHPVMDAPLRLAPSQAASRPEKTCVVGLMWLFVWGSQLFPSLQLKPGGLKFLPGLPAAPLRYLPWF